MSLLVSTPYVRLLHSVQNHLEQVVVHVLFAVFEQGLQDSPLCGPQMHVLLGSKAHPVKTKF